jgi:hypothetical protein
MLGLHPALGLGLRLGFRVGLDLGLCLILWVHFFSHSFFFFFLLFICAYDDWVISSPFSLPPSFTYPTPFFSPPTMATFRVRVRLSFL